MAATLITGCATVALSSVSVKFRPRASATERDELGFLGPVATAAGWLAGEEVSWTFDREGRLLGQTEVNPTSMARMRRQRFERDAAGRRIRMIRSTTVLGQTVAIDNADTTYGYGADGKPMEETDHALPQGTETERRLLRYDSEGRLHERWTYSPGEGLKTLEVWVHDARGLIVEHQLLAPDRGQLQSLRDAIFHAYPDGFAIVNRWRYRYGSDSIRVETQNASCDGFTTKVEVFDYRGNRIEWQGCEDWVKYSGPRSPVRHSNYRYDAHGNWTRMRDCPGPFRRIDPAVDLASMDCPFGSLVSRTITYFEAAR